MSLLRQIRFLTLRSIKVRFPRFILSVVGIVLGVAVMLAIGVTNQSAIDSITTLFESTSGKTKLIVASITDDGTGFSEQVQESIQKLPGISLAAPILKIYTFPADESFNGEISLGFFGTGNTGNLQLFGINPEIDGKLRNYQITAGEFFNTNNAERSIILVENYAEDKELSLGDWFSIITPNGVEQLRIIGLMAREGPGQINNGAFGIIPILTAQELFNRQGLIDQVDILTSKSNPTFAELEELKGILQGRLGRFFSVTYPSSQGERMSQMLQNYQIGLNFMSGIALFVGAFLIYNAFAMTVVERTREFGMLRSLGMSKGQVTRLILLEATVLGIFGSLLGIGFGILLAKGLTAMMGIILNQPLESINTPIKDLVTSWLIGVSVTLIASGIPAWQAGRISPMEALRIRGKPKESWLMRHGWKMGLALLSISIIILIANPFSYDVQFKLGSMTVFTMFGGATLLIPVSVTSWEKISRPMLRFVYGNSGTLGSRNVKRSKQRTTLTVAALMIGVAMVIMTRGMTESFAGDLKEWMSAYIGGDIYASSSIPIRNDIGKRIESVPGVSAVTPIRYLEIEWQTPEGIESINLMAIEPLTYTRVTRFVFSDSTINQEMIVRDLQEGGYVLISSVIAEKYNLSPGDTVNLRTRSGFQNFTIAAVVVDFYNQGMVIQGSWNDLRRYFRVNEANTFLIKVDETHNVASVLDSIESLYGKRYKLSFETNQAIRSRALTLMDQAFSMFDVLALIAIIVGALGVINTLTMSVIERNQEIGMLRAIGLTKSQVVKMVMAEAAQLGVIGGVLGIVTGVVLARILFIGMTSMSGYQLTFTLPPNGVLIAFIAAVILSQFAAVIPAMKAAGIQILAALHYE